MLRRQPYLALVVLVALAAACDGEDPPPASPDGGVDANGWPTTLGAWGLFEGDGHTQVPVAGVVPYAPVSPLFSDHAAKHRFLRLPPGTTITYEDEAMWTYPVDTVLVKTFAYANDPRDPASGERLIETRILWHRADGWDAMTYVWNDAQTEAVRTIAGKTFTHAWLDAEGTSRETIYRVPNTNQCRTCHAGEDVLGPLGPRTRQLDADFDYGSGPENQVDHLAALGFFDRTPPPRAMRLAMIDPETTDSSVTTEVRARAYLEANCAHCHRAGGRASPSGLYLGWEVTDPTRLGICKTPPAAGRGSCGLMFDIVPGNPDQSILVCRMASEEPEIRMPELGSVIAHEAGLEVVRDWIAAMEPVDCAPTP
jgi:uncharacterized repeat protein (TIGR03806 family)